MSANDYAHRQLTRVVSGAVDDAFKNHPDYLTRKGQKSAKGSIVKRVTGTVLSFAVQAARGQQMLAVQEPELHQAQVLVPAMQDVGAGDGDYLSSSPPDPHCRIGKVWMKPRLVAPQPRSSDGRFISSRPDRRSELQALSANLTPVQREACKARGSVRPVSDKGRALG